MSSLRCLTCKLFEQHCRCETTVLSVNGSTPATRAEIRQAHSYVARQEDARWKAQQQRRRADIRKAFGR